MNVKKSILILTLVITIWVNVTNIYACSSENTSLIPYLEVINKINKEFNECFYILDEIEFYNSSIYADMKFSYKEYIRSITDLDIKYFEERLLESVAFQKYYLSVDADKYEKSMYGFKTVNFNNNINQMTLNYKYSGNQFDMSYKPIVGVKRLGSINYFEMLSYIGSFKNSNKTYSVNAQGRIITLVGGSK